MVGLYVLAGVAITVFATGDVEGFTKGLTVAGAMSLVVPLPGALLITSALNCKQRG